MATVVARQLQRQLLKRATGSIPRGLTRVLISNFRPGALTLTSQRRCYSAIPPTPPSDSSASSGGDGNEVYVEAVDMSYKDLLLRAVNDNQSLDERAETIANLMLNATSARDRESLEAVLETIPDDIRVTVLEKATALYLEVDEELTETSPPSLFLVKEAHRKLGEPETKLQADDYGMVFVSYASTLTHLNTTVSPESRLKQERKLQQLKEEEHQEQLALLQQQRAADKKQRQDFEEQQRKDLGLPESEKREQENDDGGEVTSTDHWDQPLQGNEPDNWPDLMTPDPFLDDGFVHEFPPEKDSPYHNKIIFRNDNPRMFDTEEAPYGIDPISRIKDKPGQTVERPPPRDHKRHLDYIFPIVARRVTKQTGKGKISRQSLWMLVGDGKGLVGLGLGKGEFPNVAKDLAMDQAVKNVDFVQRFENRTIWTEMETKFGATRIVMRPRPVGFGLRCNPWIHQVCKAAGIKDISAKVYGSRNRINVIKATMRMLHSGNAPLSMGDGIGGPGRKMDKGTGARSRYEVERERGRKLVHLRK